jgi:hypothetical protein
MNTRPLPILCALVVLSVTLAPSAAVWSPPEQKWHTPPDRWKEPRPFHTPFEPRYEGYVTVTREPVGAESRATKRFSPNDAYWLAAPPLPAPFAPRTPIVIFNERPYLIRVAPTKTGPDYYVKRVEWVNEKLVYIEVWWGNVLGSCFVFDVETEAMVHREMVHDGALPFQQWQQNSGPRPTDGIPPTDKDLPTDKDRRLIRIAD